MEIFRTFNFFLDSGTCYVAQADIDIFLTICLLTINRSACPFRARVH